MKSFLTFALGAAAGAVAYHFVVSAAEKAVEVVVDATVG